MKRVLILNNKRFSYDQISNDEFNVGLLSDFEKNTLFFCKEWLRGRKVFELQTSGSTGIPKKILIDRHQMVASARLTIDKLGLSAGDTALVCIDTAYIGGKMMLVRAMEGDLNIIAIEPSSDPFKNISPSTSIDFTALVPMQLTVALETNPKGKNLLDNMKAIIVGGGAINLHLENVAQEIKAPVFSTYGMTETVSHIALKKINGPEKEQYFTVFKGIQIGQDERGCLTINGELTNNETIVTNDVVDIIDDYSFQWIGRADNIINSGGIKINAEKLEQKAEQAFSQHKVNRRFIFAGMGDDMLGEKLILVIEGPPLFAEQELALISTLKIILPPYHAPKELRYVSTFTETNTGKIRRKRTIEQLEKD